uniref:Carbamoyl phosphate synthase pyrimidine-specific large chain n=1 Tax=Bicosoecida sp. CB-2014 TaxID=1486930 RepID=A0A7S1C4W1_9STRA
MENFDPMGIHTGESIVVAPSQTLTDEEYHMLRTTALNVVRHLGVVGECNIQYTLDPDSTDYCIIEVNPRLSRSSALASKATGYPLADIAARLALGITLPEIQNAVTRSTCAFFEPSLDYVVTKIPRWDLAKFVQVNQQIGSQMKSVGEVMAIGRTFEESFQKALRMTDVGANGFEPRGDWSDKKLLLDELRRPTPQRPYALAHALINEGMTVDELHDLTDIDKWFLQRCENIARATGVLKERGYADLNEEELRRVKQLGFSDKQVAKLSGKDRGEFEVREHRKSLGIVPYVKQIDTLAAEYPASTNYLYTTYNAEEHDVEVGNDPHRSAMVLGSGTYRIGSSVEFDWCSVSAARTLRALNYRTVVVNYNPETVSTDYDESDRLYFEELSAERVMDIYDFENPKGIIVSVGGQIPNTIALEMHRHGVRILGTSPEMIDSAEDRHKFSKLVDSLDIDQPAWQDLTTVEEAQEFAERVGYPVLVRPSYVLSGAAMNVCYTPEQLKDMLNQAADVSPDHPVLVTKFANNSLEIEFDGVASNGKVVAHAVSEHVEMAGVHSGDATLVLPPQNLHPYYISRVREIAARIAEGLRITGPFNMQLLASGADVSVIECNLRASRSMPFVSKTVNCDFIEVATKAMVGEPTGDPDKLPGLDKPVRPETYVGVKSPMFSFTRLSGADPVLSVEMASTGEVACYGDTVDEALVKSLMASNFRFPKKNILVAGPPDKMHDIAPALHDMTNMGYKLHAVGEAYVFLSRARIPAERLDPPNHRSQFSADSKIKNGEIDLVINLHTPETTDDVGEYAIRRAAVDFAVPTLLNSKLVNAVARAVQELGRNCEPRLRPLSMSDYYAREKAHQRAKVGAPATEQSNALPAGRSGPVY